MDVFWRYILNNSHRKKNDENPDEVSAISFIIIGSEPKNLNKKKFRCLQIQIRTLN